jgi:hypothetical protein
MQQSSRLPRFVGRLGVVCSAVYVRRCGGGVCCLTVTHGLYRRRYNRDTAAAAEKESRGGGSQAAAGGGALAVAERRIAELQLELVALRQELTEVRSQPPPPPLAVLASPPPVVAPPPPAATVESGSAPPPHAHTSDAAASGTEQAEVGGGLFAPFSEPVVEQPKQPPPGKAEMTAASVTQQHQQTPHTVSEDRAPARAEGAETVHEGLEVASSDVRGLPPPDGPEGGGLGVVAVEREPQTDDHLPEPVGGYRADGLTLHAP